MIARDSTANIPRWPVNSSGNQQHRDGTDGQGGRTYRGPYTGSGSHQHGDVDRREGGYEDGQERRKRAPWGGNEWDNSGSNNAKQRFRGEGAVVSGEHRYSDDGRWPARGGESGDGWGRDEKRLHHNGTEEQTRKSRTGDGRGGCLSNGNVAFRGEGMRQVRSAGQERNVAAGRGREGRWTGDERSIQYAQDRTRPPPSVVDSRPSFSRAREGQIRHSGSGGGDGLRIEIPSTAVKFGSEESVLDERGNGASPSGGNNRGRGYPAARAGDALPAGKFSLPSEAASVALVTTKIPTKSASEPAALLPSQTTRAMMKDRGNLQHMPRDMPASDVAAVGDAQGKLGPESGDTKPLTAAAISVSGKGIAVDKNKMPEKEGGVMMAEARAGAAAAGDAEERKDENTVSEGEGAIGGDGDGEGRGDSMSKKQEGALRAFLKGVGSKFFSTIFSTGQKVKTLCYALLCRSYFYYDRVS